MRTVAFCEVNPYCRKVLAQHWPDVPIHADVRTLKGTDVENITLICGGFPCQDISSAGKGKGIVEGARSGLWSEYARLIGEIRPEFALVENVPRLLSGGNGEWFATLLSDLTLCGYDAEWFCLSAADLGAPHRRNRVFILAYPNNRQREDISKSIEKHAIRSSRRNLTRGAALRVMDMFLYRNYSSYKMVKSLTGIMGFPKHWMRSKRSETQLSRKSSK